jgi:hypothetical protein
VGRERGVQGEKNAPTIFFLPKISTFFGCWAEKKPVKKKYFLNNYLGSVRQEIMKTLRFMGRKIEGF